MDPKLKKTNEITRDENATIGGVTGKKVFVFDNANNQITSFGGQGSSTVAIGSAPTIFAVVNTGAPGQASVVLDTGRNYFGLATVDIGTQNKVGLNAGVNSIGFASVTPVQAWPDPKGYIGLVTITGSLAPAAGNVTLDPGSFTGIKGNVTIDSGVITTITNPIALKGNLTISDSKGFIGLVSVSGFANPLPVSFAGNVTIDSGVITTITNPIALKGNVTLSDPKTFIGSVSVGGLVDSKGFIGLTTVVPTYISGYTSFATIISATGLATLIIAPAGQKTFLRNLHVSSLGRAEFSIWGANTGATTARIPWTSLSTTGGFFDHFGADGLQMGGPDWGLNVALNGGATVGILADVRFSA